MDTARNICGKLAWVQNRLGCAMAVCWVPPQAVAACLARRPLAAPGAWACLNRSP